MFGGAVGEGLGLEEAVFSVFLACEKVKNRPRESEKILLFSQVVLYHKFRKNLAIGRRRSTASGEEEGLVATEAGAAAQGGALWPFSAGRLGSSSGISSSSNTKYNREGKAAAKAVK